MNNTYLKNNLSIIQKITLSGLFIALITILQKVIAINYIAVVPFVRISFGGCALLIFASVFLGPWYGLLIGAASDILGYFIFCFLLSNFEIKTITRVFFFGVSVRSCVNRASCCAFDTCAV